MKPLQVLLVDDNPDHRFLTRRALKPLEATLALEVAVAEDGEEALRLALAAATPGLVLLDIKMPRLDGFQVLGALRADARTARLPVVMFTSSENRADVERARSLGADDYVTKPLDAQAFQEKVRQVVSLWAARARERSAGEAR